MYDLTRPVVRLVPRVHQVGMARLDASETHRFSRGQGRVLRYRWNHLVYEVYEALLLEALRSACAKLCFLHNYSRNHVFFCVVCDLWQKNAATVYRTSMMTSSVHSVRTGNSKQ